MVASGACLSFGTRRVKETVLFGHQWLIYVLKARWDESVISEIHLFEIGDESVEFLAVELEDQYVPMDL